MNKPLAISLFGVILTGCLSSSAVFGAKTELYVAKRQTGFYQQTVIIKTNKANNPYDLWANSYDGDGFGSNPPNTLTINYAIIPWEKDRAWSMGLDNYIKLQADKLPPSAWRTYTLNTKPIMEEMNRIYHSDPDPKWTYRNGIKATITLHIDGNGNITQKVEYSSVVGRVFT